MPDKPTEMQQLFLLEAAKYHVFPIDDPTAERFNPAIARRPDLQAGRNSIRFVPGMIHLMENTVLNVNNRSHVINAELVIPEGGPTV
ncbi:MAG: hypothetical protein O7D28_06080 [Actinobacteria bacterium]|nr:hypothetical protein [Actinomycetota bacterium]